MPPTAANMTRKELAKKGKLYAWSNQFARVLRGLYKEDPSAYNFTRYNKQTAPTEFFEPPICLLELKDKGN